MLALKSGKDVRQALKPVFTQNGYAIVMVHSPSCTHCRNALPAFQQAANNNGQSDRTYASIDTTDNNLAAFISERNVSGVPTFFILRSDYSIEKVNPDRTMQGFLEI